MKGVAEIAPVGGFVKQYQVDLDPGRARVLQHFVRRSGPVASEPVTPTSAGRPSRWPALSIIVRGRGYIKDVADIENIAAQGSLTGRPVCVKNVGTRSISVLTFRRGVAELDGRAKSSEESSSCAMAKMRSR